MLKTRSTFHCTMYLPVVLVLLTATLALGENEHFCKPIEWKEKACSSDSDCITLNSECYAGKCLCTPGYYYSKSTKNCVRECEASSRQQEYMMYPKSGIVSNNIRQMEGSVDECKSACTAETSCVSFEYTLSEAYCLLQVATALTAPSDWQAYPTYPDWNMYQPYCA